MDEPNELILDEYEIELVRFCAQRYLAHEEIVEHSEFPRYAEVGKQKAIAARARITAAGLVTGYSSEALEVLPACVQVVQQWDAPPLVRDRWDEATKWFRSKAWSLPLLVLVVALPLIKGYWDLITLILGYIFPASRK